MTSNPSNLDETPAIPQPENLSESGIRKRRESIAALPPIPAELLALADIERELTKEEIAKVFEQIPLLVFADDEPTLHALYPRYISRFGGKKLPTLECWDGAELEETMTKLEADGKTRGLIITDNDMPNKKGLEVLRRMEGRLPGFGRVIQSGAFGEEVVKQLKDSSFLDVVCTKPPRPAILSEYAKAFLKAQKR